MSFNLNTKNNPAHLANWANMTEQLGVVILYLLSFEAYLVFPVHGVDVVLDVLELELGEGEDDLGQVLAADGALVALAEDTHPRAAHVADHVVTLAHAPHLDLVHAHLHVARVTRVSRPPSLSSPGTSPPRPPPPRCPPSASPWWGC